MIKRILLSAMVTVAVVQQAQARPLEGELQHLLETHPLLHASQSAIEAAYYRQKASKAVLWPTVKVAAQVGSEQITTQSYLPNAQFELGDSGVSPEQESDLSSDKIGVSLEVPIYHGGRNYANIKKAGTEKDIAQARSLAVTQDVLLEGITSYLQVARFMTLIELTKQNENSTRNQLELESKRMKAGGGVAVDAMQARTRLQIVRERSVYYNQNLRDLMANYEQVFGHPPELNSIQSLDIFSAIMPENLLVAVNSSLTNSPRISIADLETNRADYAVDAARAGYYPDLDFVISKSQENDKNMLAHRDELFVGVRLNWNISLGMSDKHFTAASRSARAETRNRALDTRNRNTESVRVAWSQVINGKERLALLSDASEISRSVMLDRKKLRDAGKETALSVLDAEVEYYGVLASRINALYDTRISAYRLLSAMGALTSSSIGLQGDFQLPVKELRVDIDSL